MTSSYSKGFSLAEVAIALGVMSITLLTLFALLPIGLKANQSSISQTAATSILSAVVSDMRATPKTSAASTQFAISFGSSKTMYFDSEAIPAASPTATSRYRVTVSFPTSPAGARSATYSNILITWPARATPANALGSCEMFAAFDRN